MRFLFLLAGCLLPFLSFNQTHLDWLSYYGVEKDDYSRTQPVQVAYDSLYHVIYIAGQTADTQGVATPGSHQQFYYPGNAFGMASDIFLAKWDTSGNLIWATYFGGEGADQVGHMAIDNSGNIVLTGYSGSDTNITTPGSFQQFTLALPGTTNPNNFLAKFSPTGQLLWSTYFGLGGNTLYSGVAIDPVSNDIFMVGTAASNGLGTGNVYQTQFYGGTTDGFIARFDSTGNRIWASYFGGESEESISNVCLSDSGFLYITGNTQSLSHIATPGADIESRDPDPNKILGFLAKFDVQGNRIWSTYLGGNGSFDRFFDLKTSTNKSTGQEHVFIYGRVQSTNLGTIGTNAPNYLGGTNDMVLLQYNETGNKLWGTYIGGADEETANVPGVNTLVGFTNSMAISGIYGSEEIHLCGGTRSNDFYFDTDCSYEPHTGNYKGFIVSMDQSGNVNWSKPFDEGICGISPIEKDQFFITGITRIDGLATAGAFKETKNTGSKSAFIGKLNFNHCQQSEFTISRIANVLYAPGGFVNYQWSKGGTAIADATNDSLDISNFETGIFTVTFEDDCLCVYTSAEFDTGPNSIQQPDKNLPVVLFPNPTATSIRLSNLQTGRTITIYNQLGQIVATRIAGSGQEEIAVGKWAAGVYLLYVNSKEQQAPVLIKFTKI